ncbi:hypothetical protein OAI07_01285 [Akkermansiaceae bacterium]|nr:hypothetical protein [Akkermansiaceae bacterium]
MNKLLSKKEANEKLAKMMGWKKIYSEDKKEERWHKGGWNYATAPELLGDEEALLVALSNS